MDDRLLARRDRLRRRCQAGLNKGESRHFLAHAVYVDRQGRITDRTFENQSYRVSDLNLSRPSCTGTRFTSSGRSAT
jgi:TnpA family transposase